jgi:acetyl esterase/lipase
MTYAYDGQVGAALAAGLEQAGGQMPVAERDDWRGLRKLTNAMLATLAEAAPATPDVARTSYVVTTDDGASIECRWYAKEGTNPGSAVLYAHGGGMICGDLDLYDPVVSGYVRASGVPFLAVGYRLAPEHPGTTPARDTTAGLAWLAEHAGELGIDPARIAVMGDSGGGGIAAGATLLARDRGLVLSRQLLIYPMLDDRTTTPEAALVPFATWGYDANYTVWHALLGEQVGADEAPPVAAPARAGDLTGLPPAYLEVGELDIFRDETLDYARKLTAAGVPIELHVHPGAPHAFDRLAPHADLTRRAAADRARVLASL